jgi:tRNA 2-selenouridine synthase
MNDLLVTEDRFKSLFLNDTPFLDVRAEVEYDKGSFPASVNIPLLNTDERHQVGTSYKQNGQQAAISLGEQLVSGNVREQRIKAWTDLANGHPDLHLYCWRGGMRSKLTQETLAAQGINIPLIQGGYKALRNFLLNQLKEISATTPLIIIGGKTGSAKTTLINKLATGVDLEHFANHRGSSFGRRVEGPPSQANFEHMLAIEMLKKQAIAHQRPLFLEDESHRVGSCALTIELFQAMKRSPIAIIEAPTQARVEHILQEYVQQSASEFCEHYGDEGFPRYRDELLEALHRIRKRLGGERYTQIRDELARAIEQHQHKACVEAYRPVISRLLSEYYDPMYNYQIAQLGERIVFSGSYHEVLQWAQEQQA